MGKVTIIPVNCCSGESTARRVSLGSHNEADFWDQVAEGALMAQVVDIYEIEI